MSDRSTSPRTPPPATTSAPPPSSALGSDTTAVGSDQPSSSAQSAAATSKLTVGTPPPSLSIPPTTAVGGVRQKQHGVRSRQPHQQSSRDVTKPASASEWQLYVVLQRANLLQYYDTFIAQGGDDVHQLVEACGEEFLEIMALVGMASKPLHVRRLQKSLQEFSMDPLRFATPLPANSPQMASSSGVGGSTAAAGTSRSTGVASTSAGEVLGDPPSSYDPSPTTVALSPSVLKSTAAMVRDTVPVATTAVTLPPTCIAPSAFASHLWFGFAGGGPGHPAGPSQPAVATANVLPGPYISSLLPPTESSSLFGAVVGGEIEPTIGADTPSTSTYYPSEGASGGGGSTPVLTAEQTMKIRECSDNVVRDLPEYLPKLVQNKRRISSELLAVMNMKPDNPYRLEQFRRYSAIYGRFDAKRKPDRRLTLHEVSVNEAATQICLQRPALLTRRDDLFPLARKVVRDAGYCYARNINRPRPVDHTQSGGGSGLSDTESGGGTPGLFTSSSSRRRRAPTPAESVTSSGGDDPQVHTPSSSTMGSPPPTQVQLAIPLAMQQHHLPSSGGVSTQPSTSMQLIPLSLMDREIKRRRLSNELTEAREERDVMIAQMADCNRRMNTIQDGSLMPSLKQERQLIAKRIDELTATIDRLQRPVPTADEHPIGGGPSTSAAATADVYSGAQATSAFVKEEPLHGDEGDNPGMHVGEEQTSDVAASQRHSSPMQTRSRRH